MALRLACLLTLAFFSANVFAGDVLRFTFNPPNGTEFVETVRSTKTVSGTPKEAPDVDVTETRGAYSILKTQDGYLVKTRAVGPSDTKASPKVEAIQNAILDMKLTYVLDRRGHLQRIMGLESTLRAGGMYETASSILQLFGITDVKAFVEQQWVARELFIAGAVD